MWTLIILLGIGFLIGIIATVSDIDFYGFGSVIFGAFIGALIGGIFGFLVGLAIPSKMTEEKSTFELVNLQDGSQVSGNFFLGCGAIEGKMKYVFYYKQDSITFAMSQIDYDKAQVRYTKDSTSAYLEQYKTVYDKNFFWNNFSIDTDCGSCRFIIYVPKGTIKTNYNLDAQ